MVTYLDDVLDPALLGQMMDEGYVQVRYHPDYPYAIYCYTKQAMFDRKWNDVTKTCRGLIVNEETGEVLARPFRKFFNYGEPDAPIFSSTDWVTLYDKADGSLGIAYDTPGGPAIATKGSFISEQAVKATELLRAKYPRYDVEEGITDLFEIIYPENRIVLDYGNREELLYLGSVWVCDGVDYWQGVLMECYEIPKNRAMYTGCYTDVLATVDLNRPNREGVVLHNEFTGDRLKMKQEDYLELHKVMTGLNERQLWEWLSEGKTPYDILTGLPEELHGWAEPILIKMSVRHSGKWELVQDVFDWNRGGERKHFAIRVKDKEPWMKGALFAFLDGNWDRVDEILWKRVWEELKPSGN